LSEAGGYKIFNRQDAKSAKKERDFCLRSQRSLAKRAVIFFGGGDLRGTMKEDATVFGLAGLSDGFFAAEEAGE
jgi:hypothetical protein